MPRVYTIGIWFILIFLLLNLSSCTKVDKLSYNDKTYHIQKNPQISNLNNSIILVKSPALLSIQYGSGVIIKETRDSLYILSCEHVLSGLSERYVEIEFNVVRNSVIQPTIEKRLGEILLTSKELDLVLIKCPRPTFQTHPVKLHKSALPKITSEIYHIGRPMKIPQSTFHGTIIQYYFFGESLTIVTDGVAYPGISGGGLFTKDERLLGIIQRYQHPVENISYSISSVDIIKFLIDNNYSHLIE